MGILKVICGLIVGGYIIPASIMIFTVLIVGCVAIETIRYDFQRGYNARAGMWIIFMLILILIT